MRVLVILTSALFLLASNPALFSHAHAQSRRASCQNPIRYRIGTLDPRFGIGREEFRRAIEDASNAWAIDRNFFRYDPQGKLRINLVYDTRQEITQHVILVRADISARMKEADSIEDRILFLKDKFRAGPSGAYDSGSGNIEVARTLPAPPSQFQYGEPSPGLTVGSECRFWIPHAPCAKYKRHCAVAWNASNSVSVDGFGEISLTGLTSFCDSNSGG